ncbi:MAG TPA: MFS transporter [Termitinemataceae bacterium]|nr:MFS transporter [Termitinemataceae bacterium]HOM23674.1 MFS transporter [Termitinemataceae bacterium]HPP99415.1 MFS transporter [Termitinemataceae bacterium]
MKSEKEPILDKKMAILFIVLFGVISLFADMNYEGGRSVVGQYLKLLGTSAFALGLAAGLGEFVGYALRFVSGSIADKTRKYWLLIILGYTIGLTSLPMMAFFSGWQLAIIFLFLERVGKAIRKPAVDAVLSFASKQTGSGFGFGLHEAMDQLGAFLGPALFSLLLFTTKNGESLAGYRKGLLLLFIPAGIAVGTAIVARFLFPHPQKFELKTVRPVLGTSGYSREYWIIVAAAALLAMGITDFPLIGLHLKKTNGFVEEAIPLLYAGAMAVDAAAAIVFGFLYDRFGLKALLGLFVVEVFTAPLIFMGNIPLILAGMVLWGISVGTQESILRAAIGDWVDESVRGRAYGLFHTVFGFFWFVGSAIIGVFYDLWGALPLVIFSVITQLGALVLFSMLLVYRKKTQGAEK